MRKNASKPLLTISLLISNRPDTIPKCLDSLQPIREAIPSELILVDTSKNPEIHSMLLEYTDLVYEFEWCKDFSKARNVGLKKARGKWFMFLDDDEWFVDSEEIIKFFKSGEYKQYGCANYVVRNFFDPAYTRYSDGWGTRLYQIDKESAFYSKVHEYLAPIRGKKKHIESMVYHSGYIFLTEQQQREHFVRNTTLLYEMIEQEPQNLRWKMQLVQEYASMREKDLLENFCKECIDAVNEGKLECSDSILCCFFSGQITALVLKKEYEEALRVSEERLEDSRCVDIFRWQLYYRVLESAFWVQEWDKTVQYGKLFLDATEDPKKREKVRQFQNTVMLLGEVFDKVRIYRAHVYLIICDLVHNSTNLLNECYDKIDWQHSAELVLCEIWRYFLDAVENLEYEPIFGRFITDACRVNGLRICLTAEAEARREKETYEKIIYAFAQADSNDNYVLKAKMQIADWDGDVSHVQKTMQDSFERTDNAIKLCGLMTEFANKYQIDVYSYWMNVGADNWKNSVRSFFAEKKEDSMGDITQQIERVFAPEDWRRLFYEMSLADYKWEQNLSDECLESHVNSVFRFYERYLKPEEEIVMLDYQELQERKRAVRIELFEEHKGESYEDLELRFHQYMLGTIEYYLAIYKDEAFEGDFEILPPEARAAVWLNEFFGKEETDWEGKIGTLRKCARASQSLGERIKVFARLLAEQRDAYVESRAKSANFELQQMVEAMKIKIRQMAEQGLKQEALSVLLQVRALAPNDMDLLALEEELKR